MDVSKQTTAEKIVDFIGYSQAALQKAHQQLAEFKKTAAAVSAKIPQVVEALVANDRIDPSQREKAAQLLRDPETALEVLVEVAKHRNAEEARLGSPTQKTASAAPRAHAIGQRYAGPSEADRRFLEKLGLEPFVE